MTKEKTFLTGTSRAAEDSHVASHVGDCSFSHVKYCHELEIVGKISSFM